MNHDLRRFQIYYGPVDDAALQALQEADLVLLEPRHISLAQVRDLRAHGVQVYGYLSVMETPTWNDERYKQLRDADFFRINGEAVRFPAWDSYLMDLRTASYRRLLVEEVQAHILAKEMDGVFLDTVGDIEEYVPAGEARQEMMHAYVLFLQQLASLMPAPGLIQNRGFDLLAQASPYLQGVLWEDWRGGLPDDEWEWVELRLARLRELQLQGLRVLAVSSRPEPVHAETAKSYGFVHLSRLNSYHTL